MKVAGGGPTSSELLWPEFGFAFPVGRGRKFDYLGMRVSNFILTGPVVLERLRELQGLLHVIARRYVNEFPILELF